MADNNNQPLDPSAEGPRLGDCFGRRIRVGDLLMTPQTPGVFYRVAELTPELDPKAPPGTLRLGLVHVRTVHVPEGQQVLDLIKIRDGRAEAQTNGEAPQVDAVGKVTLQ